jgi:hypothetical protein
MRHRIDGLTEARQVVDAPGIRKSGIKTDGYGISEVGMAVAHE